MKIKLFLIFYWASIVKPQEKQLKQVLILSRHNVRSPLSQDLVEMTPKRWPKWKEKKGYLTEKGALLEGFMGDFFASWLHENDLLSNECPTDKDFFAYANVKQRTKASAQSFVDKAFPSCNVTVHVNTSDDMDPIFNPVIHNKTSVFKRTALQQMQNILTSLSLNNSYLEIEDILNFKESEICKIDDKCDLTIERNKIINLVAGFKPNIKGPLKIGNSVIDAFVMQHYEGFPMKNVAWGRLVDKQHWDKLMNVSRWYHNVIFNTTLIAKDISKPLLGYISNLFLTRNVVPKVTLLMGHDANLYTLLNAMHFRPYSLPNQHEVTPVGGKVVFQKWFEPNSKEFLLKINYVYQSTEGMRNGEELSLENPPEFVDLILEGCRVNEDGFCPWKDFLRLLKNLLSEIIN